MTSVRICDDRNDWDDYVLEHGGHPLQLWGWGEVKAAHGWKAKRLFVLDDDEIVGAAQVLLRPLPSVFHAFAYVPRGPVGDESRRVEILETVAGEVKRVDKAVVLSVEPDWLEFPEAPGWRPSANTVLIPRTLILDLEKSEDELLGVMAKKTRQYIRKSASDGVEVRRLKTREELVPCLEIYHQTAERAGFAIHDDQYYYDIFDSLGDHSPVFAAFSGDTLVAFLWLAISSDTAFELYGGMNDQGQQLRANYTLKWKVIQTMKVWGIERYDMNGLLNDGVSTFKQSFAAHEDMLAGTYDKPLSPLYAVWTKGLPLAKRVIRTLKRR